MLSLPSDANVWLARISSNYHNKPLKGKETEEGRSAFFMPSLPVNQEVAAMDAFVTSGKPSSREGAEQYGGGRNPAVKSKHTDCNC